eukprot:g5669.t1
MAEVVRLNLERMIPELEELRDNGIFNENETNDIVKERRRFEYRLKNRGVDKKDFLDYITYELNLEILKRQRKKEMGVQKRSKSDYVGVRRIHSIFTRALKKFQEDIRLWLQYADFCARSGSTRSLARLFPKALQLHPRSVGLWIHAASFEISCNNNYDASRKILQRGLRINKKSQKMWLEYFRMELLYLQRTVMRREVLGIDDDGDNEEKDEAMRQVLDGAIPKAVFHQAMSEISDDVRFAMQFYDLSQELPVQASDSISSDVEQYCRDRFGAQNEMFWNALAKSKHNHQGVNVAVSTYEMAIATIPSVKMFELFASYLINQEDQAVLLKSVCQRALDNKAVSNNLFEMWISGLMRLGSWNSLKRVCDTYVAKFPSSVKAWSLVLDLAVRSKDKTVETLFNTAIKALKGKEHSLAVHEQYLDWSISRVDAEEMNRRFQSSLRYVSQEASLCRKYISWASMQNDTSYLDNAMSLVLTQPFGRPNDCSLFLKCANLVHTTKRAVSIYEQAVLSSTIREDARIWIAYVSLLRNSGDEMAAGRVQWRATESLKGAQKNRFLMC